MKIQILTLLIIGSFLFNSLGGQNLPTYNKYYNQYFMINPSTAGADLLSVIYTSYEKQWLGIPNSPSTQMISINGRIGTFNFYDPKKFLNKTRYNGLGRVGLGCLIANDINGPIRNQMLNITYSYHVPVNNKHTLSFGLSGIGNHSSYNMSDLKPDDITDELLINGEHHFSFDVNTGVSFNTVKYSVGIAVNELFESLDNSTSELNNFNERDFFVHGEYFFEINSNYTIEPLLVCKYYNSSFKNDIHVKLRYKRFHWLAVSLLNYELLKTNVAFKVHRCHAGYSYSQFLSKITGNTIGTHMVFLGYNIGMKSITGKREALINTN